ncbi:hypothetical protein ACHAWF_004574 [Thalassiosira exigua]
MAEPTTATSGRKRRRPRSGPASSAAALASTSLAAVALCCAQTFLGSDLPAPPPSADFGPIRRVLSSTGGGRRWTGPLGNLDGGYEGFEDCDAAYAAAFADADADAGASASSSSFEPPPPRTIRPYTLAHAAAESSAWEYTFALIVYDPPSDAFVGLYSKDMKWKAGNRKLWKSVRGLAYVLRKAFPDRFTPRSPELVLAVGSGDYPHAKPSTLPRGSEGGAPVLMFGSAFRDPQVYPNLVAMPMPEARHLGCLVEWAEKGKVCGEWRAYAGDGGDERAGAEWDDLIPQVIWRGTDFGFLQTLQSRPSLVHPNPHDFVRLSKGRNARTDAVRLLDERYDSFLPRWKGVALSAAAELEAEGPNAGGYRPWIDVKLSSYLDKGKSPTLGSPKYAAWESVGIGVGKGVYSSDLAKYRYHIDLGGGGGTTWSGTIEKLALPGLLFHHVTPTKDYIHDRMRPWRHYIPVRSDLKDLRRKFDWAEGRPDAARRIADAGAARIRELSTPEGFGRMFEEDFVGPLRRILEAYQPVPGGSWRDKLTSMENFRMMPVMECHGRTPDHSCSLVGGDAVLQWQRSTMYKGD